LKIIITNPQPPERIPAVFEATRTSLPKRRMSPSGAEHRAQIPPKHLLRVPPALRCSLLGVEGWEGFAGECRGAAGEPVAWYGPIVMNTDEELQIAYDELQNGKFIKIKTNP
jgi:hypothetical protein